MIDRLLPVILLVAWTTVSGAVFAAVAADPAAEANKKLRETLRNTMIQLRNVETEKATLQVAQTELEQKNMDLEKKIEGLERKVADLIKQSANDKAAAEKKESELASSIATRDLEIEQQAGSLKKWKDYQVKAEELVKKLSADRASKASQAVMLQRRVDDQQRRNSEMYKLGAEILDRYAKFGLGTALSAREPFVGVTRVKLENLVQDFSDKLADARIKPGQPLVSAAPQTGTPPGHAGTATTPAKDAKAESKKNSSPPNKP